MHLTYHFHARYERSVMEIAGPGPAKARMFILENDRNIFNMKGDFLKKKQYN